MSEAQTPLSSVPSPSTSHGSRRKPIDGRIARGLRTREAVVSAFESLIAEGGPIPTAAQVAERAGVSCRSIFTHFGDMDGVVCAVAKRVVDHLLARHEPIGPELDFDRRVKAFVAERSHALDTITPLYRTAALQSPLSRKMKEILGSSQQAGRAYTLEVFEPELQSLAEPARSEVREAIIALTSWPHWNGLRRYQDLEIERAAAVVRREISSLLRAPA